MDAKLLYVRWNEHAGVRRPFGETFAYEGREVDREPNGAAAMCSGSQSKQVCDRPTSHEGDQVFTDISVCWFETAHWVF
jgi:hypothetical protein